MPSVNKLCETIRGSWGVSLGSLAVTQIFKDKMHKSKKLLQQIVPYLFL